MPAAIMMVATSAAVPIFAIVASIDASLQVSPSRAADLIHLARIGHGARARRRLAIIERRRPAADQRLVDEARPAALVELGLGGRDLVGACVELRGRERERLR